MDDYRDKYNYTGNDKSTWLEENSSYVGKTIQITSSPYYTSLQYKHNPYFDMSEEHVTEQLANTAMALAEDICDEDKVEFLTVASSLGTLDGGDATLNKVNSRLDSDKKVSKKEIFATILRKIFPNEDEKFFDDVIAQIESIYNHNNYPTEEAKVVAIAGDLELISRYMNTTNKWDIKQATQFIFEQISKIKKSKINLGKFDLGYDVDNTVKSIKQYRLNGYVHSDEDELLRIVDRYKLDEITREQFIDELFDYRSKKKTRGMN